MRVKPIVFVVVVALAVVLVVALRTANRADAAGGNCYSDAQGPTTPQICS